MKQVGCGTWPRLIYYSNSNSNSDSRWASWFASKFEDEEKYKCCCFSWPKKIKTQQTIIAPAWRTDRDRPTDRPTCMPGWLSELAGCCHLGTDRPNDRPTVAGRQRRRRRQLGRRTKTTDSKKLEFRLVNNKNSYSSEFLA